MNSATDNPLVFVNTGEVVSGGNFHGEYPAKVMMIDSGRLNSFGTIVGFGLLGDWRA